VETRRANSAPLRGTQSFVYTLSSCWQRPSLTLREVAWRWAFGIPATVLIYRQGSRILQSASADILGLQRLSLLDPMAAATSVAHVAGELLPPVASVAVWMVPLLFAAWVVASSLGRTMLLRRVDATLHRRPVTLMALQAVRMAVLAVVFVAWFGCVQGAARLAINGPIAAGQEPNLVLYCAITIIASLGMFTLWAVAGWAFSVAPLLAMLKNLGAWASLAASFRLGPLRSKLVEINLVMGIVKIALIVVALVLSACPLPFESVATPDFMLRWYVVVTLLYLIASDFFHVVRLVSYLELWKALATAGGP
jgi:hypothetical protein